MPLAKNVMRGGLSAGQAKAINGNELASAVTAAGTTQGTATALVADGNVVSAGGADAGVQVYNGELGDSQWIFNNQATNCRVYPPTSARFNQIATNGAHILQQYTFARYTKVTTTQWAVEMSA